MKLNRIRVLIMVAAVVLSVLAGGVLARADDGMPADQPPTGVSALMDALRLIAEGVGAGFVLSFLAERFT